jgi:NADH:ubiquinone oxidoreductase subunit F (NADH-binding)
MPAVLRHPLHRVLDEHPCERLADYVARGGGRGLEAARSIGPTATIDMIAASGLRGRGGAGFPTGVKWRTVAQASSAVAATTVVVNGAEGEPGTFKDRALLRQNPFKVLEGALIAALAVGADDVVVALKSSFAHEHRITGQAIEEIVGARWADEVSVRIVLGPAAYLFGEETALLEVVAGRQPVPRVSPPYRRGLDPNEPWARRNASTVHLAGPGGTDEPPALVDNVETLANVPSILAEGPEWFRSVGTAESPGTLVSTVTGRTQRHAVGEVAMGTPLGEIIDVVGGGVRPGRTLVAALSGVANAIVPAALFDTPATYEDMRRIGCGLGAGGFIVFDDESDLVAVAHAAARFLAVESCGQCEPCKLDGLAIAEHLDAIRSSHGSERDLAAIRQNLGTVTRGARCFLAQQQELVVASILAAFPDAFAQHIARQRRRGTTELLAPIVDIVGGQAVLDTSVRRKQPDWTYGPTDSGAFPADLYADEAVHLVAARTGERPMAADDAAPRPDGLDDPFAQIAIGHRCIQESIQRVRAAGQDWSALEPALHDLRHHLQVHDDVTSGVLYAMLERATGEDGEEATLAPREEIRVALHAVERILRRGAAPTAAEIDEIDELSRRHRDAGEREVLPMLRDRLDDVHLATLRDALATAMTWRTP